MVAGARINYVNNYTACLYINWTKITTCVTMFYMWY